jgi:hypothetical protein
VRGKAKVIVINNSWRLAPWADVLYASDWEWWASEDVSSFSGMKVSRCDVPGVHKVDLRHTGNDWHNDLILTEPGFVGAGGHGGFAALDLAYQFGSRDIALVGYDMRVDRGIHWHGRHEGKRGNPTIATAEMWRMHTDRQADRLREHGARVVNCSPVSALRNYEKTSLEKWLHGLGRARAA